MAFIVTSSFRARFIIELPVAFHGLTSVIFTHVGSHKSSHVIDTHYERMPDLFVKMNLLQ